jgi:predicted nucleic acid-binding protein
MSDEIAADLYFVDSNVWLYIFLPGQDIAKARIAKDSEDMQDGLVVDGRLTITNPFVSG